MATPHISAEKGDFAKTVLMPMEGIPMPLPITLMGRPS